MKKILQHTKKETIKAVVHCQGSHAFTMSIASGLLPEVTRVVANSTAMTPKVRNAAAIKLPIALGTLGKMTDYFDPQYGLYAPSFSAKLMDFMVDVTHHECRNAVCKHSSFVYGVGFPTLWSHHNLDPSTHDWIEGEFAHVPVSLFRQTRACLKAGHLVPAMDYPEIPTQLGREAPRTNAVFTFITGGDNHTFRPIAMRNSWKFFNRHSPVPPGAPPKHGFKEYPGYGHLDMFLGQYAAVDVFPDIIGWLSEGSMTGMRFRETMTGRVALRTADPVAGYASPSAFAVTMRAAIDVEDVAAFVSSKVPTARLRAELVIPVLGGRFLSNDGKFELFKLGTGLDGKRARLMTYTARFENGDRAYEMTAVKYLQPSWQLWGDSTTAHVVLEDVTVYEGAFRPRHAAGFIKVSPTSFLVQLTTMRGFGARTTWSERRRAVQTYVRFFVQGLAKTYLCRLSW